LRSQAQRRLCSSADTVATTAQTAVVAGVVAAGCALLLVRPPLLRASANPTATLVILFTALLVVGLAWPLAREPEATVSTRVTVLALGVAAFAVGRLIGGGTAPASPTTTIIALSTFAAVAEEAFFRRFVYGALAVSGPVIAVAGSALLFAAVHVTVYGAWVLPIDFAAGLLLGWQRWAAGTWRVPAITHALANVLVVV
jgi:membrane protease YdiL (CAAX protease family)